MESGEVKKYYIWNSTSRKGKVEIYLAETEDTVYFESGRFCTKLEWETGVLQQIEEDEYNRKNSSNIQTEDQFSKWEKMLGNNEEQKTEQINNIEEQKIQPVQIENKVEINPIRVILDKQKKKEVIKIPIEFKIDVPSKKVMSLLEVMFDREEVTREIIKSVTSTIDVDSIVNEIETQIRSSIEASYEEEKDD